MKVLLPFNKFAYPSGWARAGIDRSHPAFNNEFSGPTQLVFSGIGTTQHFLRLDQAQDIVSSSSTSVIGAVGPGTIVTAGSGGYDAFQVQNAGPLATQGMTIAGIFAYDDSGAHNPFSHANTGTYGLFVGESASAVQANYRAVTNFGQINFTNPAPVRGDGIFFAASATCLGGSTQNFNCVGVHLRTGATYTTSGTISVAAPVFSGASYVFIGNQNSGIHGECAQPVATCTVLYNFLSIGTLLLWAKAPWDFWYQPAITIPQIKTAATVTSTESGSFVRLPRGNKFAYPGGWARPGFDPNHLAAGRSGAMASGIAMPASSVMQQLIFSAAPIFGNNAAIAVNTSIGPAVQCSGAGVTARTGPRMPGTFATPNAFTCGIIYYFLGTGNGGLTPVLAAIGNGGTTQHGIGWTGTSTFTLNFGNSFTPLNSGITQVLTDWVFAAASYDRVSTKYSFLVMGLRTGVIRTASGTSTQTLGSSNDGVLYTGGFSTNNTAGANIAAVMYAENNFLSVSQLVQWAAAPWDFWYPPIMKPLIVRNPGATSKSRQIQRAAILV